MGGACPTHAIASIYTGNYTTSADANRSSAHKTFRIIQAVRHQGTRCSGYAGQLAVLDEGGDHRPIVAAFVRPGKERILAIQSDRSDRSLDSVRVEVDAAVVEELGEPVLAAKSVAECLGQLALGTDLPEPCFQIRLEVVHDDTAALLARSATLLSR